jgi:hypothetical protein
MGALDGQAARLEAAVTAILGMRGRMERAAPWPLAELYGTEAEASWGPPELLAHLDEALPFWLGEAERILDGDPSVPVPFGRTPADEIRIGLIGRDRTVPLRELLARLESDGARVAARMRRLTDAETARLGNHPARGEHTIEGLFERFVTSHVEGHVAQLSDILDVAGA